MLVDQPTGMRLGSGILAELQEGLETRAQGTAVGIASGRPPDRWD